MRRSARRADKVADCFAAVEWLHLPELAIEHAHVHVGTRGVE